MGLTELTAPPPHISREDHAALTSSTPQSFDDIPPVLRFKDNVEIVLTAGSGSGSGSFVNLEGRVRGTLWVTEANLAFLPEDESRRPGFKLEYQSLTLHALTPATNELEAHLYCQIDDGQAAGAGDGNEDEEDYGEMKELRVFVGQGQLSPLFEALSDCSALHASLMPSGEPSSFPFFPPNEDGSFDDADDDEWEDDADGNMENGNGNGEEGGRVHLTRGSGHVLMSFSDHDHKRGDQSRQKGNRKGKKNKNKDKGDGDLEGEVDQMERFLNMVDWGNVPKPTGWEEGDEDRVKDALEPGEVEDVMELAKRLGAVDVGVDVAEEQEQK